MAGYEQLSREVAKVKEAERALNNILNPPWVQERAALTFPGRPVARELLDSCRRFVWTYQQSVGPNTAALPESRWPMASTLFGESVTLDLSVHALLPPRIANATEPVRIKLIVVYFAGGAVSCSHSSMTRCLHYRVHRRAALRRLDPR